MRFLTCLILSLAISVSAFAQGISVSGTVTDPSGAPLAGVTVTVQGNSMLGTSTDGAGKYAIQVPGKQSVLEFTYIGYNEILEAVGERVIINPIMSESTEQIDVVEVVQMGYLTVGRRELTGATGTVMGKDLASAPVANVAQALQGKLAGVNVMSVDGRPGGDVNLRVRGGTSISGSNEPLVLIDGIPGSMNDVSPDLVLSIDVLKDASTTAIYGTRGANGVIVVTTKRAAEGKVSVSYNGYAKWNTPTGYIDVLSPYDYLVQKWGVMNAYDEGNVPVFEGLYGVGPGGSLNPGGIDAYKNVSLYDLQKKVYNSSFSHNHDVSLSSGTDKTKVLFNFSYMDEQGMKVNSWAKRAVASLKFEQKIGKDVTFNFDARYVDRKTQGNEGSAGGAGSRVTSSHRFRPIAMDDILGNVDMISNGKFTGEDASSMLEMYNPYNYIVDRDDLQQNQIIRGTAGLTWNIIKGLTARSELSMNRNYTQNKTWTGPINGGSTYLAGSGHYTLEDSEVLFAGNADFRKDERWGLRWSNTLNYVFKLNDIHNFNVLVGQEVTDNGGTNLRIQTDRFPANYTKENAFAMINQGTFNTRLTSGVRDNERMLSMFGRLNYSLLDRYIFTATFRADGSANFVPENQWGYFPAAAVAWRISGEEFMKNVEWVSDLKLRVSYGTVGNDNVDPGKWQQLWESEGDRGYYGVIDNTQWPSYDLANDGNKEMANPDLKWETTITRNIGLDYSLLQGKLWGSIDYYHNTTKDLLMRNQISPATGFRSTMANVGQTSNKGLEVSVNGVIFSNKEWNITGGVNIAFNRNNVDELAEGVSGVYWTGFLQGGNIPNNDYLLQVGSPVGLVVGYKTDGKGFYTTDDFTFDASTNTYTLKPGIPNLDPAFNATSGGSTPAGQNAYPGMPKFVDKDGSGAISYDSRDTFIIGDMTPDHTGGFNVNAQWKNFDLGLYFNWSYGNDLYNAQKIAAMFTNTKGGSLYGNRPDFVKDSYQYYRVTGNSIARANTPAELDELNKNAKYPSIYLKQGYVSDLAIEDGSYLRLNTLTLGYTLPKHITKKIGASNLRVYGTVYNVFTLTGYSGMDPEMNAQASMGGNHTYPTPGFDWGAYPRARQFVLGLNVNF